MPPYVVIVGAGFRGIAALRDAPASVTVIE
jgi:cation diffusion facilitator CzcD-associated flavoprotein CzcO